VTNSNCLCTATGISVVDLTFESILFLLTNGYIICARNMKLRLRLLIQTVTHVYQHPYAYNYMMLKTTCT